MKDRYGHRRILNIATFSTEGSRSALLSAARGMGIDSSEVAYLTSLIPVERGFTWSLSDAYFGNEEKGRKPVTELVNAVKKYDGLMEASLKIEGLVKGRSVHASGIYKFEGDYTEQNAMMKSTSGQEITQFDMQDSDQMGALKIDCLTVQAIDRIRTAMDLLIEYGYIEDKGSLRATYDAYLHPDVLEYDDKEMWAKVANNEIPDLFQFDTAVGLQCAKKTKPQSVEELAAANSLMRLMPDGAEQPMDKFVRHKENPEEWYKEMAEYGLTDEEVKILEDHLKPVYGVGSSQEEVMLLLMDERICGFSVREANVARKIIGKKQMERIPELKEKIFSSKNASRNLLQYIWDTQIEPQLGYSFSVLHATAYSLIALQEMNIAHKYPRIFWDTACLTILAGADEDNEHNKASDYGRVASSIGKLKAHGVKVALPSINQAGFSFTPDIENNQIIFSLKGITSMNDDIVKMIIDNRPYKSFEDFYERIYKPKHIQRQHMLMLIKAGCFNEFDSPIKIMQKFILKEMDIKESLNMQNFPSIIRLGLLDNNEFYQYKEMYELRKRIVKNVYKKTTNPKDEILKLDMNTHDGRIFNEHFTPDCIVEQEGNMIFISKKTFDKEYNEKMNYIKELIGTEEFIKKYNQAQFVELWNEYAAGTVRSWEMEAVSFYSDKHELHGVNYKLYGISQWEDIPEEPIVESERKWRGRTIQDFKLFRLAGTVLDKNNNNHTFTLLTETAVVNVKTYAGAYSHYNKQIKKNGKIVEKSWFTKGNLLLVQGYRRGDQFVLKAPKGQHTINLITEVRPDGTLGLQAERA